MYYIGVIGQKTCDDEMISGIARSVGREIARTGSVLVSGGMGGVMYHSCRGAFESGGTVIGILPGLDREDSNPYLTYSVVTGIGAGRNQMVALSSDALIAISGGPGTLSEIAFAIMYQKPVIAIGSWYIEDSHGQTPPIHYVEDPVQAVETVMALLEKKSNKAMKG